MKKNHCSIKRSFTPVIFSYLIAVVWVTCYPGQAWASVEIQEKQRITLFMQNTSVEAIVNRIRSTTDYRFLFHADDVKNIQKKEFSVKNAILREAMDKLVEGTGLTYTLRADEVVVLSRQTKPEALQPKGKYKISGIVLEAGKNIPVPYATVFIPDLLLGVAADENGAFELSSVPAGKVRIEVRSMGLVTVDSIIRLTSDLSGMKFYLSGENFRLNEVTVTAQNSKAGQATASTISRTALDHVQATSLKDILQLLPGGVSNNPTLNQASQMNIRALSPEGAATDMNSLGASIVRDGVPMSNNSNMQVMSPAISGAGTSVGGNASPAGGVDLRTISTDNIESVEVIRGIPSVEYGDMTSGVLIINSKAGREPFRLSFKTNPNIYQVSAGKGFNLGGNKGSMNISGDYVYNVKDPVEAYAFYQRGSAKMMYSNVFFGGILRSTSSVEFIYGDNRRKLNPDDEQQKRSEQAREMGVSVSTNGTVRTELGWLKNIRYTLAVNYMNKKSFEERLVGNASYPYSMTTTDGAILSNKPGVDIFDKDGNKLTNIPVGEEGLYANFLPNDYFMRYDIQGKELNAFGKVVASFLKQTKSINNRILIGADLKSDGNKGAGKTFDPLSPPYRILNALYASFRPRKYSDIPFVNQLGLFAEENFRYTFADRDLNIQLGVRYDKLLGNKDILLPRLNASLDVIPRVLTLRGGYGVTAKMPTMLYLHPDNAYFEFVNFNNLSNDKIPEDQRLVVTTTRVFNSEDKDLAIARNKKAEIGFNLDIRKTHLTVTAFQEKMNNGYSMAYTPASIRALDYTQYKAGTMPSDGVTFPALNVDKTHNILVKYRTPSNNMTLNTRGVEFDLRWDRFESIRTAFSVNGAWMRTEHYDNGYTYYDDGTSDAAKSPHMGMYEPGMKKSYVERLATTFRATHNIPQIGLVVTLSAQVIWKEADWNVFGNDSIPVSYISKTDGQVHPFELSMAENPEFASIMRKVNKKDYIKESMPPVLSMNLHITKEIRDFLRVSFFANNMFKSRPLYESKRAPGSFQRRNNDLFFGLELSAIF